MIQQEFCILSMYRILLFLIGPCHGGRLSESWVGGSGSTPLLACGCTTLLGLGLEVPCQTPELDGFEASLLHPFQSSMELPHFLVHLGQGFFDVGVPHCRLCGGGFGGSQFFCFFTSLATSRVISRMATAERVRASNRRCESISDGAASSRTPLASEGI